MLFPITALEGRVNIDAIRTLHTNTMEEFGYPEGTKNEVNALLDECEQLLTGVKMIQEMSPKSLDQLVSYGERCSVRIMAQRLNQLGVPAQAFDAWDVGICTDSQFGDAQLLPEYEKSVRKAFERIDSNVVAIVTGFIGHDPNGKITTLGRGGSDLTATALGAALGIDEIQVWKDVDGILSTDPRVIPHAVALDQVSYEEAAELAYFGAQVLHPIAMQPAMKYNIPVRVKNSYNPSAIGTIIKQEKSDKGRLVSTNLTNRFEQPRHSLILTTFLLPPPPPKGNCNYLQTWHHCIGYLLDANVGCLWLLGARVCGIRKAQIVG
jgi:aspartate kinase